MEATLFFAYAKFEGQEKFRLFSLKDNRTYFLKAHAPRYKIEQIERAKELAIKLVELNKQNNLHIKFIGINNKTLWNE